MKVLVEITAQYFENYAYPEAGFSWKPKGTQTFHLYADDDYFLYGKEYAIAAIKRQLLKQSNDYCKVEFVSLELIFHEPIKLDDAEFDKYYDEEINAIVLNEEED
jgi:hypothetical protein